MNTSLNYSSRRDLEVRRATLVRELARINTELRGISRRRPQDEAWDFDPRTDREAA